MDDKFYTIEDVARLLDVHRTTVYNWMKSGQLKWVRVGGRRRIPAKALEGFIIPGTPPAWGEDETKKRVEILAAVA